VNNLFIAEATIQKQNVNERHLPGHYTDFTVSSSAGDREKQSHNRMIDSH